MPLWPIFVDYLGNASVVFLAVAFLVHSLWLRTWDSAHVNGVYVDYVTGVAYNLGAQDLFPAFCGPTAVLQGRLEIVKP